MRLFVLSLCFQAALLLRPMPAAVSPALRTAATSHLRAPVAFAALDESETIEQQQQQIPVVERRSWRRSLQKRWRGFVGAAVVSSAVIFARVPGTGVGGPEPAVAVTTSKTVQPKKPTALKRKKAKSGNSGALSTFVMIGGVAYWAYSSAKEEDDEEIERIQKETENLDRLQKEFTDIDEGVVVDEDLFASLKKRMANSTDTNDGGADGESPPGPNMGGGDGSPPVVDSPGGGAAVLEPPGASPAGGAGAAPEDAAPNLGDAADIERLNKMFGMGDADK